MAKRTFNVLFLCTGNSARSILAESHLNATGRERFRAFSAGSHPKGEVHPLALELLQQHRLPTENLRNKSWDEFAKPGAPELDFVVTVCDKAAGEVLDKLDRLTLQKRLDEIGRTTAPEPQ